MFRSFFQRTHPPTVRGRHARQTLPNDTTATGTIHGPGSSTSFTGAFTTDFVTPLDPRDAFFGGRTKAVRAHCRAGPGCRKAFTTMISRPCTPISTRTASTRSGIPSFTRNLLAGRPKNGPQSSAAISFWLVKCRILSPHFLFQPVLPIRVSGKLLFSLCVQCARDQVPLSWTERTCVCDHTPRERACVSTWCTSELTLALENGLTLVLSRKRSRPTSLIPGRVSSRRRDPPGSGQKERERGSTHVGKTDGQQFLGKIRTACQQDPGDHLPKPFSASS